ncbi:MAG: biliverdin-producing heme oxygenase [Myxococcales bacterium]|nr:biliverdin-producing heme oxygenase [Myxococcales bacterium]
MSSLSSIASMLSSSTGMGGATREIQPTTGRVDFPLTVAEEARPPCFSKRIRAETAQAHRITESTSFVKSILRGAVDIESYRNMQTGLYLIYSAMEEELERHCLHPLVRSVYFSALSRCSALEQDLDFLWGEAWRDCLQITPARQQYVDRIRWVGENDPGLLVAHSYTRYMGDLSGGQVVERVVRRSLKIQGKEGFRFFHFDDIHDVKEFKNIYRRRLDGLAMSQTQAKGIIAESNRVFTLNRQIFEELEGSWIRALVKLVPTGFSQRQVVSY